MPQRRETEVPSLLELPLHQSTDRMAEWRPLWMGMVWDHWLNLLKRPKSEKTTHKIALFTSLPLKKAPSNVGADHGSGLTRLCFTPTTTMDFTRPIAKLLPPTDVTPWLVPTWMLTPPCGARQQWSTWCLWLNFWIFFLLSRSQFFQDAPCTDFREKIHSNALSFQAEQQESRVWRTLQNNSAAISAKVEGQCFICSTQQDKLITLWLCLNFLHQLMNDGWGSDLYHSWNFIFSAAFGGCRCPYLITLTPEQSDMYQIIWCRSDVLHTIFTALTN